MDGQLPTVVPHPLGYKVHTDLHTLIHSQSGTAGADAERAVGEAVSSTCNSGMWSGTKPRSQAPFHSFYHTARAKSWWWRPGNETSHKRGIYSYSSIVQVPFLKHLLLRFQFKLCLSVAHIPDQNSLRGGVLKGKEGVQLTREPQSPRSSDGIPTLTGAAEKLTSSGKSSSALAPMALTGITNFSRSVTHTSWWL